MSDSLLERIDQEMVDEDRAAKEAGQHWVVWPSKSGYAFRRFGGDGKPLGSTHWRASKAKVRDVLRWMGRGLPITWDPLTGG